MMTFLSIWSVAATCLLSSGSGGTGVVEAAVVGGGGGGNSTFSGCVFTISASSFPSMSWRQWESSWMRIFGGGMGAFFKRLSRCYDDSQKYIGMDLNRRL